VCSRLACLQLQKDRNRRVFQERFDRCQTCFERFVQIAVAADSRRTMVAVAVIAAAASVVAVVDKTDFVASAAAVGIALAASVADLAEVRGLLDLNEKETADYLCSIWIVVAVAENWHLVNNQSHL